MRLKDFIIQLQDIQKEYGDDLEVIWTIDDEGNDYKTVDYDPGVGHFIHRGYCDNEWHNQESCEEEDYEINAVIIN